MPEANRAPEPDDGDERSILLGWLAFHRDALFAKCAGLRAAQLVSRETPPSRLSLLGLIRHLCEMERSYGSWPLGGGEFRYVWGDYLGETEGDIDCTIDDVETSFAAWFEERAKTDAALAGVPELEAVGANDRSARWNLVKLIGEYARHNGHADLLRERIDGRTGE